jgi:hypothetical protein
MIQYVNVLYKIYFRGNGLKHIKYTKLLSIEQDQHVIDKIFQRAV